MNNWMNGLIENERKLKLPVYLFKGRRLSISRLFSSKPSTPFIYESKELCGRTNNFRKITFHLFQNFNIGKTYETFSY